MSQDKKWGETRRKVQVKTKRKEAHIETGEEQVFYGTCKTLRSKEKVGKREVSPCQVACLVLQLQN